MVKQMSLTEGSIRPQLLRIAVPMSVGLFFNTLFNVVDTFYAGRLGTESLAGMSASFSVFFIQNALLSGLATGVSALMAQALGRNDPVAIQRLKNTGLVLIVSLSLLLTIAGLIASPWLLYVLGARDLALSEGSRYVRTIYAGSLFWGINASLHAILSAHGQTRPYRNFLVIGFFLNLILDPLFIFGWLGLPRMGTMGVALATVLVQAMGTVYLSWQISKSKIYQTEDLVLSQVSLKAAGDILTQGIPAALNMLTIALGVFVINWFIYRFGSDAATAGYGVAVRIEQLALLPALGLNTATLAMVGQNAGAGKLDRVREVYHISLKLGALIMTIGMALLYPLAPWLIALFNQDPDVIAEGTSYLRIEFLALNAYVILNVCLSLLQGLKKPHYAVWIGLYRQIAMPILIFNLLGRILGLGLTGVWWGIVFTTWSGAVAAVLFARFELKRIIPEPIQSPSFRQPPL
ncbi:MAG: MATE family efflux transporter [Clostridia bacterium]|nr:MATE family efflux transporter [Clostridia bacterium]NCC76960.1 MATE family efflux transporter [Clostridia bacterium]